MRRGGRGDGARVLRRNDFELAVRACINIKPPGHKALSRQIVGTGPQGNLIGLQAHRHHAVATAVGGGECVGPVERDECPAVRVANVARDGRAIGGALKVG